ncbi:ATP-dependent RNA helicase mss116 [Xylariaceae sp. FL0016]|nr:ATP-dependent RNA helicase mss116 [Xylariaceae sp. FL0016]
MFKTTVQRQARLGGVARRQLSTVCVRPFRPQFLATSRRALPQGQTPLRPLVLRQVATRLSSSQSAAAQADGTNESEIVGSAPVTRFAELTDLGVDHNLVQALTKGMGYETMTEVQSMTINPAMKGVDLVAQAKTGTGKTLAFLIPIFHRVLKNCPELSHRVRYARASSRDIRAIILSPTRELAEQIGVEARKLAQHTGIVVQTAVGGTQKRESLNRMRREGCHILVATPGRLQDLLTDPAAGVAAPHLQAFVLDEADRMLDVGFSADIRNILDMMPPREEVDRQTLLFSATIPRDVIHLAKSMVKTDNFEFVQTIKADDTPTHERVPQHIVQVQSFENFFPSIMEIAEKAKERDPTFKAIVFFSNTATVQYACNVFRRTSMFGRAGLPLFDIHSRLTQQQRTRSAEAFRRSTNGVLLSSDVTARGMDFPGVTHVIQVGLPPDRDQYIHRVGRTGRAGNVGEGWLLLAKPEIPEARARLPGLPIKPNHTIESAQHDFNGETEPTRLVQDLVREISAAYARVPKSEFSAVYNAWLGQKFGRNYQAPDAVQLLNSWALNGVGLSEVPAITPKMAANRGLTRTPGIRIGYDNEDSRSDRGRSSGFGESRFGSRGGDSFGDKFGRRDTGGSRYSRSSF